MWLPKSTLLRLCLKVIREVKLTVDGREYQLHAYLSWVQSEMTLPWVSCTMTVMSWTSLEGASSSTSSSLAVHDVTSGLLSTSDVRGSPNDDDPIVYSFCASVHHFVLVLCYSVTQIIHSLMPILLLLFCISVLLNRPFSGVTQPRLGRVVQI